MNKIFCIIVLILLSTGVANAQLSFTGGGGSKVSGSPDAGNLACFDADENLVSCGSPVTAGTLIDGKWCIYSSSTGLNCTESEPSGGGGGVAGKICKTITNPSAADNLLFDIASARTVTKLWGISVGGTSVVATLVNAGGDGTGDTTIASFTVDGDGATQETIASASLANGDVIKLDVGTVTGVVTQVMVCYE